MIYLVSCSQVVKNLFLWQTLATYQLKSFKLSNYICIPSDFKSSTNCGNCHKTKNQMERQCLSEIKDQTVIYISLLNLYVRLSILDVNSGITVKDPSIRNVKWQNCPNCISRRHHKLDCWKTSSPPLIRENWNGMDT